MRLIFLYVSWKHGFNENIPWNPIIQSDNFYANRLQEEGYCLLIRKMLNAEIIDDALLIIESKQSPGYFDAMGIKGYVIPSIKDIYKILNKYDIIWVRGGWKHWHDTLIDIQRCGNWIMLYAANTGRQKWKFWDIVFNDRIESPEMDKVGRLQYPFNKIIDESTFKRDSSMPNLDYDIMIGASHVHDKKGQWRVINALIEYKEIFEENLKAILPGSFMRGEMTNLIAKRIQENSLNVKLTGMIPRIELARFVNRTKLFIHLGSHGQADRGPLEAMACGCPVMIGFPEYHPKWYTNLDASVFQCTNPNDPKKVARDIYFALQKAPEMRSTARISYNQSRIKSLINMNYLFSILRFNQERKKDLLKNTEWSING